MKLHGFKHLNAEYIAANFCGMACCEGTIGLAFDVPREFIIDTILTPEQRLVVPLKSVESATDELMELEEELRIAMFILPMMFEVGLRTFFWCGDYGSDKRPEHKHVSVSEPCPCGKGYGFEDIDWI